MQASPGQNTPDQVDPLPALRIHAGGTTDWSISREAAAFLETIGGPDKTTLETGAGLSTLILARQGGRHICITPSGDEIERIRRECVARDISLDRIEFIQAPSERVLPQRDLPPLDAVLIDGAHGFPLPQIDFYYTAPALKIGGLMIVDDVQIWACGILARVLREEPGWEYLRTIGRRTIVFRKTAEFGYREFCDQPYVSRKTRWPARWTAVLRGLDLLREGQFSLLLERVRRKF